MSDGIRDSRALDSIANELEIAAYALKKALKRASDGHRGLTVSIKAHVNQILQGVGYKLVPTSDVTPTE